MFHECFKRIHMLLLLDRVLCLIHLISSVVQVQGWFSDGLLNTLSVFERDLSKSIVTELVCFDRYTQICFINTGTGLHTSKPSTWEISAGGYRIWSQPGLYTKLHTNLGYKGRSSLIFFFFYTSYHNVVSVYIYIIYLDKLFTNI